MRDAIEAQAGMTVTQWVGNAHQLDETTVEHIYEGDAFMAFLENADPVPVKFVTAPQHLVPELDVNRLRRPVLPIHRQLVPPWRKADQPPKVGSME